ncbi:MAG: DUF1351 domain-containing protein [Atopobiaceae bacterium]|nr:DUF1351 domain-containing protein [Atopobiaceae bacterium]
MAKANETRAVEATIIEEELGTLSKAEQWLAGASDRVAERCELYRPPARIENDTQRKDAVAARTQVRKDVAEIDAERKAMLRDMEDALKKFKANVKDVLSPLTDLDARYKALLDEYEAAWKASREMDLAEEYDAIAPDLVPIVPFSRLLERYGMQRGKVWTNRSTNVEAAKEMLADAVGSIAEGERTIADYADPEDVETLKARYFETLDVAATISEARRLKDQRERVRQLEEQRRKREEAARIAAEQAALAEAERRAAEEAARAEAEAYPYDYEPAEAAVPAPVPPAPIPYEKPATMPAPPIDTPRHWIVDVPSATRAQMQELADVLGSMGLRGNIRAAQ